MHIGFLTPEYPEKSHIYGGIATSVKALASALADTKHEVTVFLYGKERDYIEYDGAVRIVHIKMQHRKFLGWWINRKHIESVINRAVEELGVDLVEAPDWTGITAFMRLKAPLLIRLHGSDTYFCHIEKRRQKYKNYFFEKKALHSADHIVSVSRYTADLTRKLFDLSSEIEVISNGVNIDTFENHAEKYNSKTNTILYFGTLIRKKGVLEIPHIFNAVHQKLPEANLYLVGADAQDVVSGVASTWKLMQKEFSEDALNNVYYLGKVPHDEMVDIIGECKVCIFPSYAEAFPVSWLEAMAMGKPIVASDIGWAKECIEDGKSGLLVYPKDHQRYADKIVALLKDEQLREKLSKGAHERVKGHFDMQVISQKNIAYYQSIVNGEKK